MNIVSKRIINLSQIIFIYYIFCSECASVLNKRNKFHFTNNISKNNLCFINSYYPIESHSKSDLLYKDYRCKVLEKDDSLAYSDPFSKDPKIKTKTLYKMPNIKGLVLSSSAELNANLSKFVKKVKDSKSYKVLSDSLVKVKDRLSNLNLFEQFGLLALGNYVFTYVLPKYCLVFPFQLFPTDSPLGLDIGCDTLVSVFVMYYFLKDFKFPDKNFKLPDVSPLRVSLTLLSVFVSFVLSGPFTYLVDSLLVMISGLGYPVSSATKGSISILSNHLFWITLGFLSIHYNLFPVNGKQNPWYNFDLNSVWVYKVLGGYLNSTLVFKLSNIVHELFKKSFGVEFEPSSVEQTITDVCQSYETLPIFLSALGPCITAPWWEELLYRVLIFRTVNTKCSGLFSSAVSSLLFTSNHLTMDSFLHLFTLGFFWSMIHVKENNIWINVLIHSLWNSRAFLSNFYDN